MSQIKEDNDVDTTVEETTTEVVKENTDENQNPPENTTENSHKKEDQKDDNTNADNNAEKPDENQSNNNTSEKSNGNFIPWENTKVEDLSAKDITQLLRNRRTTVKSNVKEDKIQHLKQNHTVVIDYNYLTNVALESELRLQGLSDEYAKKDILLARLKGEAVEEPPKKKARTGPGRRRTQIQDEVHVAMYQFANVCSSNDAKGDVTMGEANANTENEDDDINKNTNGNENKNKDGNAAECLGVFKSELKAYDACIDKLLDELENKNYSGFSELNDSLDKMDDDQYKEKLELVEKSLQTAFRTNSKPKVWIETKTLQ